MGELGRVEIEKVASGAGALAGPQGTSMLIVSVSSAYQAVIADTTLKVNSLLDAEAKGITKNNDQVIGDALWVHVKNFYAKSPGATLYLYFLADTVTFDDIFDPTGVLLPVLEAYLASKNGEIKLIGVCLNPSYDESTQTESISADLQAALPKVQAFHLKEFDNLRPNFFILEGRNFTGTLSAAVDLSNPTTGGLGDNHACAVVSYQVGEDVELFAAATPPKLMADVGGYLGAFSVLPVMRKPSRVQNGDTGYSEAFLSDGRVLPTLLDDNKLLASKNYTSLVQRIGKAGLFYNGDYTATAENNDYFGGNRNRTINKAAEIANLTYVELIDDEVSLNRDGTLTEISRKTLEALAYNAIKSQMIDVVPKELDDIEVYIDPSQNVRENSTVVVEIGLFPVGHLTVIKVKLSYKIED